MRKREGADGYKRFIKMLAYSSGNPVNISDIAKSLDVSQPTVKSYIEIAEGTFLWRNIKPYEKNLNTRIIKAPKGYIRDTGLINYSLGLKNAELVILKSCLILFHLAIFIFRILQKKQKNTKHGATELQKT